MNDLGYVRKVSDAVFDPLRGKSPLLQQLDIELTERCNNRCIHCYINRPEDDLDAKAREMETVFVLDLLQQAADLGCLVVRFTGGEPLLRSDFPKLYLAARRLGMKVILLTNARLVTPELASLLSRVPPGRPVEVTVYGMHSESYDAVVGVRGAFDEFRRGVMLLLEKGVQIKVKGVILPTIKHEMAEFEAWAATIPGAERQPAYVMNFNLRARRDDPEKNRRIAALRLPPLEIQNELTGDAQYISDMQMFCEHFMKPPGNRLFVCGAGHTPCIDSYGNAQMCLLLRHPDTIQDLKTCSLRQVLTKFFPEIRELKAMNQDYLRRCANCFLKELCDQCPAKSWMEHGTLDRPIEYLCEITHILARSLGFIGPDEFGWEVIEWRQRLEGFSFGK